jgi:hypothetical protein
LGGEKGKAGRVGAEAGREVVGLAQGLLHISHYYLLSSWTIEIAEGLEFLHAILSGQFTIARARQTFSFLFHHIKSIYKVKPDIALSLSHHHLPRYRTQQ